MAAKDPEKYFIKKPLYEVIPAEEVVGRLHAMTLMNRSVPGCDTYVEAGWVIAMPDPATHIHEHVHDYDEVVLHIGTDPNNPEDLGGEIEIMMDGQPVTINTTSGFYVPKGMKHGPLTWKRFERPHIEMSIMLGAGSIAEADPGGHRQK